MHENPKSVVLRKASDYQIPDDEVQPLSISHPREIVSYALQYVFKLFFAWLRQGDGPVQVLLDLHEVLVEHDAFLPAAAEKVGLLRLLGLVGVAAGQFETVSIAPVVAVESEEDELPLEEDVGGEGLMLGEIGLGLKMEDAGVIIVFCDEGRDHLAAGVFAIFVEEGDECLHGLLRVPACQSVDGAALPTDRSTSHLYSDY